MNKFDVYTNEYLEKMYFSHSCSNNAQNRNTKTDKSQFNCNILNEKYVRHDNCALFSNNEPKGILKKNDQYSENKERRKINFLNDPVLTAEQQFKRADYTFFKNLDNSVKNKNVLPFKIHPDTKPSYNIIPEKNDQSINTNSKEFVETNTININDKNIQIEFNRSKNIKKYGILHNQESYNPSQYDMIKTNNYVLNEDNRDRANYRTSPILFLNKINVKRSDTVSRNFSKDNLNERISLNEMGINISSPILNKKEESMNINDLIEAVKIADKRWNYPEQNNSCTIL